MPLLNLVGKDEATGQVADIYEMMINNMGFIPNAFKVYSPSEHILNMQVSNLGYFMRHKTLGGKFLAFVRLLISEQEQCIYCVNANSGILLQYGVLPEVISEVKMDPSKAPLEKNEVALLLFVLKLVKDANSITQDDVDTLKNLGWTDSDILEASYHGTSQVGADKLFNAFKIENDF